MKIFCKLHSSNVFGPQKEIKVITAHLFVIKIANGVNLSYNNLIGRIITFYKDEEHVYWKKTLHFYHWSHITRTSSFLLIGLNSDTSS